MGQRDKTSAELGIKGLLPYSRSLHWLILTFAMVFPAVMASIYFVFLATPAGSAPGYSTLAAYGVSKFIEIGLPFVCVWVFERQRLRLSLRNFSGLSLGLGFGLLAAG